MKKLFFLLVLFLASCAPVASSPTPIPDNTPTPKPITHPDLEAFSTGPECAGLCWLGIHIGTSRKDAVEIFSKSPGNINTHQTLRSLEGEWYTDKEKSYKAFIAVHFTADDIVDSISLGGMKPFTVGHLVKLLGEPSKMWITWTDDRVGYGYRKTQYALHYPELKIEVQAAYSGVGEEYWDGPSADTFVEWIRIGLPSQYEQHLQPWLGYGHKEDYRPNAVPTPAQ